MITDFSDESRKQIRTLAEFKLDRPFAEVFYRFETSRNVNEIEAPHYASRARCEILHSSRTFPPKGQKKAQENSRHASLIATNGLTTSILRKPTISTRDESRGGIKKPRRTMETWNSKRLTDCMTVIKS